MAAFCLRPEVVQKFKEALKSGEIDPLKLSQLSSDERHSILSKYVGEDAAKQTNALFESKLLLKNQKAGYISWAKKVAGISKQTRLDLISKIERLDKVLNPTEEKAFLKDLASTKLGTDVSLKEATKIADLSKSIQEKEKVWQEKQAQNPNVKWQNDKDRLAWGRAKYDLSEYINELKAKVTGSKFEQVKNIAGSTKAIQASLDDSALLRQGWKTLWTHPLTWQKNARQSFVDMWNTFGGKNVMREVNADILSRPYYDQMVKGKLAIGKLEEAFPTTLPEKIPGFGKVYKASENAYTSFLYRQRADIFGKYLQIAQKSGLDINDTKVIQPIASMVNSLTGRGNFGKYEGSAVDLVNNVFFSPRYVKSQFDTLGHVLTGAGGSNFVRKQAAINLLKVVAGTAAVLTVAKAINPASVEIDPRSSDFGKIKIGDTRFDVTGGMGSLVVLASRLILHSTKSTSGNITELDSGKFGAPTTKDVIFNFASNKFSPLTQFALQLRSGTDSVGNKVTPLQATGKLVTPLPVQNITESLQDPKAAPLVLNTILDSLGIATNTYAAKQKTTIPSIPKGKSYVPRAPRFK